MLTFVINGISGDADDKIAGLFPAWETIVTTILATGILLIVLTHLVWKPVKDKVAERQQYIQDNINNSLKNQEEALKLNKDANENLIKSKAQASDIVSVAYLKAQENGERIVNDANHKATRIMQDNEHEIKRIRAEMQKDIENEIVDVALSAASEIIEKNIDTKDNHRLISRFIDNAKNDIQIDKIEETN